MEEGKEEGRKEREGGREGGQTERRKGGKREQSKQTGSI